MEKQRSIAMVMALSLHWRRAQVTRGSAGDSRCWRGERAMVNPTCKDHDMYMYVYVYVYTYMYIKICTYPTPALLETGIASEHKCHVTLEPTLWRTVNY